ncbi:hypothetical protein PCANC_00211 [Puccinia coronata f. sp. avenae]|uniref:Uncharacterized protein n=1 Tax=Puccinia coronata f. sp. avenae TaxID=200324 RepID=A0A2N5W9A3_9BASI|nr:hypothetical protein PCANC_00211 [Puccinia coronata f. sp. avenae]
MCTKSVHGKVRLTAESVDQGSRKILISRKAWEGVECHWADHATYSQLALIVSCESLAIPPTVISFPTHTINKLHANGIECMDVAGEWIVTWGRTAPCGWIRGSNPIPQKRVLATGLAAAISQISLAVNFSLAERELARRVVRFRLGIHVAPKRFLDSTGTPAPLIASQSQDSPLFLVLALLSGALHFADLPSLKPIKLRTLCITMDHAADSPIEALAVLRSAKLISWGTRTGTLDIATLHWHLPVW